jgi:hypothetical protein
MTWLPIGQLKTFLYLLNLPSSISDEGDLPLSTLALFITFEA